jgi:hypothetical protein
LDSQRARVGGAPFESTREVLRDPLACPVVDLLAQLDWHLREHPLVNPSSRSERWWS